MFSSISICCCRRCLQSIWANCMREYKQREAGQCPILLQLPCGKTNQQLYYNILYILYCFTIPYFIFGHCSHVGKPITSYSMRGESGGLGMNTYLSKETGKKKWKPNCLYIWLLLPQGKPIANGRKKVNNARVFLYV